MEFVGFLREYDDESDRVFIQPVFHTEDFYQLLAAKIGVSKLQRFKVVAYTAKQKSRGVHNLFFALIRHTLKNLKPPIPTKGSAGAKNVLALYKAWVRRHLEVPFLDCGGVPAPLEPSTKDYTEEEMRDLCHKFRTYYEQFNIDFSKFDHEPPPLPPEIAEVQAERSP